MRQAADIRDAVNPDEILFVIDAMIGQDAVATAKAFEEGVDFTGVVLSKLDGDARGGAALSVARVTGRPILFASTGEKLTDFEAFHLDRMASRILDMGDVLTLIEQAEKAFDADEAAKMAEKVASGQDFTLADFLVQMQQMKNMGSMKKMLGMLPGMGQMREALDNFDEREVDRIEAIIRSMTPAERENPKIINGSRRARIARGSGVTTSDVNRAPRPVRGGAEDDAPDEPRRRHARHAGHGQPAGHGGKKARGRVAPPAKGRKAKSGNPAKRAAEEAARQARALGGPAAPKAAPGAAFGALGGAKSAQKSPDPADLQLPPDLEKFLGR